MTEIIPAVNAADWRTVEERIKLVEPHVRWVHLDVADGTFTPNVLWHNSDDLKSLKTPLQLEVHLMIKNPGAAINDWIAAGAKRIIVHVEAMRDFDEIKRKCDVAKVFLMLAITPETSWTILVPYLRRHIVSFQILAVHPGASGQQFIDDSIGSSRETNYIESSYEKIRRLREQCSYCDIEVDGGIKVGIAKKCREAGANLFSAASAIFETSDIPKAIEDLKRDVV